MIDNKDKIDSLYDKLEPEIYEIFKNAREGRYLQYHIIGKSVEGRDMNFVVLAKDKESVDQYLNHTLPKMLENPAEFQRAISANGANNIKIPIFFNNMHPDEPPAVDAILTLLRLFSTRESLSYRPAVDKEEYEISIDEALHNIVFLFNFTVNPDGLHYNTRKNRNSFDLNRDNAYQTQPESKAFIRQIVKWNPITFLDFHGYIKSFLIEPSTPPHDPNYEYDLLMDGMIEQARLIGNVVTANTKFKSFKVPLLDSVDGWDDASPRDASSYVLLHGIMGHTIEIPENSREAYNAFIYAALAAVKYTMDNKYKLINNQLECFRRGIEGIDAREADKYFVNAAGERIGRPRGEHDNFFPEYYVIPVDNRLQRNTLEALNSARYLLSNGVMVCRAVKDIKVEGITYPKGTYIVPMHQPKRGYVNSVFYRGMDVSDFKRMHGLMMMNFPALRGFDIKIIRTSGVFDHAMERVTEVKIPSTTLSAGSKEVIIRNTNNDAVRAVNRLLNENAAVKVLLEKGSGYRIGDYLVSKGDFDKIKDKYLLDALAYNSNVQTRNLIRPRIACKGTSHTEFVLRELGFNLVDNVEDCEVIVDDYGDAQKEQIEQGKHYIGIGGYALRFIKQTKLLKKYKHGRTSFKHEGLLRAEMVEGSPITSGYGKDEMMYFTNGSWIERAPDGAVIFARAGRCEDFFVCGWWPGHERARGKILGFTCKLGNSNITLFASDITKNAHPQNSFRLLANAIFASCIL